MSLQLILGGSGSGKSTYLYEQVIQGALREPGKMFIVLVPEQYTMQTQRLLVGLHPRHGLMNIEILSFERLALRIFDELGTDTHAMLGETGKSLVLRSLATERAGELPMLGAKLRRPGFLNEVKSLISELSLYNISPEELTEMAEAGGLSASARARVGEIAMLYRGFLDRIDGSFITAEQVLELLIPIVGESGMVRGSVMVFDGFTGFTPLQNELMLKFLTLTDEVRVALCVDANENVYGGYREDELFAISKRTAESMRKMALMTGCELLPEVRLVMDGHSRFPKQNAIAHIEKYLFRGSYKPYGKDAPELTISECRDPRRELSDAAARIRRLVRQGGYRYRDIAVCTYDLPAYSPYIEDIFSEYGIPCFVDEKSSVSFSPCFELLRSAIELIVTDYRYDSVTRFLRSGPWILSESEKDRLDLYIQTTGLRGRAAYANVLKASSGSHSPKELAELEAIRAKLWDTLRDYDEAMRAKPLTVEAVTRALYDLLVRLDIEKSLAAMGEAAAARGDEKKTREYEEIYRITIELLDQFVDLLGGEEVTAEEYGELFAAGADNAKVGRIPATNDSVIFGDIERTRVDGIRCLFLLGANDGVIPRAVQRGGLLTQSERLRLTESGYELAPSDREQTFMQRFYLYMALTKPSERLYVSFSEVDGEGGALRPSYLIAQLRRLVPKLTISGGDDDRLWIESRGSITERATEALRGYADGSAVVTAAENSRDASGNIADADKTSGDARTDKKPGGVNPAETAGILAYLSDSDEAGYRRLLAAADYTYRSDPIGRAVMRAIDGGVIRGSVSRMESYASCAARYFYQYTLGLTEPTKPTLEAVDMGTLYHDALAEYEQAVVAGGYDFATISDEESDALLAESVRTAFNKIEKMSVLKSARQSYILKRMNDTLRRTAWALRRQVRAGDYVPSGFEVSLSEIADIDELTLPLSGGDTLRLSGRIDRYDRLDTGSRVYIKIIDYKSSKHEIDLGRVYQGLEIQLLYYMKAASDGEARRQPDKEILPAAVFYYALDDPRFAADWESDEESIDRETLRALRPNGLLGGDEDALFALDRGLSEARAAGSAYDSEVVPAKVNKDGSFSKTTKRTPNETFSLLCDYTEETIRRAGESIAAGEVTAKPYRDGDRTPCAYCPYGAVCGFEQGLAGYEYRRIENLTDDEAIAAMRGALGRGGETETADDVSGAMAADGAESVAADTGGDAE